MIARFAESRFFRLSALCLAALVVGCAPVSQGEEPPTQAGVIAAPVVGTLTNGDFESGTLAGWTSSGATSIVSPGRDGQYAAEVGSLSVVQGANRISTLSQTFTLPSDAAWLSFWMQPDCYGATSNSTISATLADREGRTLALLAPSCLVNPSWLPVSAQVVAYAGEVVTLTFVADDGDLTQAVSMLIDDVRVSNTSAPNTPICSSNVDCGAGEMCVAGICEPDAPPPTICTSDAQCGSWEVCVFGTCETPLPPASTTCTSDAQCGGGQVCESGACVDAPPASSGCNNDDDCGAGQVCEASQCTTPPPSSAGDACDDDSDCDGGWVCQGGVCSDPGVVGCGPSDPDCTGGSSGGCDPSDPSCGGSGGGDGSDNGCDGDPSCDLQRAKARHEQKKTPAIVAPAPGK